MDYKYEHICKMKQPVLCEVCNKSYAIGVMKKHKQTKMHIEHAKNHGVPSSWWFVGGTNPDAFPSLVSTHSSAHPSALKTSVFIKPFVST